MSSALSTLTYGGTSVAVANNPAKAYAVGIGGASDSALDPMAFPIKPFGFVDNQFLPSGTTVLTAAHFQGQILTAVNPADTTLSLPKMATLGLPINSDGTARPYARYEVLGTGRLFINLVDTSTQKIVWNGQDPQGFAQFSGVGVLKFCGVDAADSKETWAAG